MTTEQFEKAKRIDNNIMVLENRQSLIKKIHSQILRNEVDPDEILQLLTDYSELVRFTIDKEKKEFEEI